MADCDRAWQRCSGGVERYLMLLFGALCSLSDNNTWQYWDPGQGSTGLVYTGYNFMLC